MRARMLAAGATSAVMATAALVGCGTTPGQQAASSAAAEASSLAASASAAQRAGGSAADSVAADLEALALALDNVETNTGRYPPLPAVGSTGTVTVGDDVVTLSPGNSLSAAVTAPSGSPTCFAVTHAADAANPDPITYVWKPGEGGLQPPSVTRCG